MEDARQLYLELMKRCLLNYIYGDTEEEEVRPIGVIERILAKILARRGMRMVRPKPMREEVRSIGREWPRVAHSMIGMKRMDNLHECLTQVLEHDIPGDLIETGVWRGGAVIFMRAALGAYGVTDRVVWAADSFEGLPPPTPDRYPDDAGDDLHTYGELAVSLDEVRENFQKYGLLDEQVRFLKGWFRDTLPDAPIRQLALMRLDGDMYESTMDALSNLYPKLSPGGYVIVDDYGNVPACRKATDDFRAQQGIHDEIKEIDWTGAYWQRSR